MTPMMMIRRAAGGSSLPHSPARWRALFGTTQCAAVPCIQSPIIMPSCM